MSLSTKTNEDKNWALDQWLLIDMINELKEFVNRNCATGDSININAKLNALETVVQRNIR